MEGCGPNCAKIILIFFNIIFWLSGLGLLAIGIWVLVDSSILDKIDFVASLVEGNGEMLKYASYVLIAVGLLIAIVGFFGCCGALKENKCLLGMYVFLLILVMLGEIAIAVLAILFNGEVNDTLSAKFKELAEKYFDSSSADYNKSTAVDFRGVVDSVQTEATCCGWVGSTDYGTVSLPKSCCAADDCTATGVTLYDGCKSELEKFINEKSLLVIGLGVGIACLEIFGIIFGLCLCRNVD